MSIAADALRASFAVRDDSSHFTKALTSSPPSLMPLHRRAWVSRDRLYALMNRDHKTTRVGCDSHLLEADKHSEGMVVRDGDAKDGLEPGGL
ncbi:hypothetical protein ACFLSZ_03985 [Candidatus Bipolaricaulota bacterium]